MNQTKRYFWLDVSIFATFTLTAFTGLLLWLLIPYQADAAFLGFGRHFWLTTHICSGLANLAGSVVHVIWHREWLKALRNRRLASLPPKLRTNRVIDRFVWIAFLATNVIGVLNWMIPASENSINIISRLHAAFGLACLLGITIHLALHAKWITSSTKNIIRVKKKVLILFPDH